MRARAWLGAAFLAFPVAIARAEEAGPAASSALAAAYRSIAIAVMVCLTMVGSVLGSAWAVGRIGTAVMGAAAEKPELLTRSLVFLALAEGLAVLGFAVSVMLLQKL